ncbi:MAG: hypothetical protein HQL76_07815 [Magnetococcales bacterium]|nr:hypothetical protein [Magnetococcales bacterium]
MIPLQILIKKDSYAIARAIDAQELVSDIRRMEDALTIFDELTRSGRPEPVCREEDRDAGVWRIVPGCLSFH